MNWRAPQAVLFAILTVFALPAYSASPCTMVGDLMSDAMFARYPAKVTKGPWRAPDVRYGRAHYYRTIIRNEGVRAPNFAGRYRVVALGCGAATTCPAFLDRMSGRVLFSRDITAVSDNLVHYAGEGALGFDRLTYRPNSRLIIALGMRNEDERTSGAVLYEWRQDKLHLIRFVPQKALCMKEKA